MEHFVINQQSRHRPLLGVAISFGLGILLNEYIPFSFALLASLAVLFLLLTLLIQRMNIISTIFLLGSIVLLGALFSKSYQVLPKDHIYHVAKYYRKNPVLIEGVIASDVEDRDFFKGKKTIFMLDAKCLKTRWGWKKKSGKVLVNIFHDKSLTYGDCLIMEGKLHKPFEFSTDGTFSYGKFLNRKGIRLILSVKKQGYVEIKESNKGDPIRALSLKVKHRLKTILSDNLSKNENSIMQAVLLGDRYNIPKHIRELFQISGVAHILAISGLHLGIVGFLIFLFLKMMPIPRKGQYLLTILLLIFYSFLTGGRSSVIRATVMGVVFLASFILEREGDSFNTLGLAALLILLMNPLNLFDVGFQLSFISVFTIISFYPKFMNIFKRLFPDKQPIIIRYLLQSSAVSLAAYLGVAGLIAYYFQIVTPIALLANLIVVPLISAIVALGMGLLFVGVVLPPAIFVFANCIKILLNVMVASTFLFVQVPGAYFEINNVSIWGVILYYILFFLSMQGKFIINSFLDIKKIWRHLFFVRKKL
ncbi:MAG: ComEC family competence protein [Candidatus Omnitrophica bacterium]|nr:ComEC family competence protein [Candidatus Omnitrophota bacterium]